MLTHNGGGEFAIGKGKGVKLYDAVNRLGLKARFKRNLLLLSYTQLEELARLGFVVRLLNDAEKDAIKEVKPVMSTADVETIKRVLEEMAKMARIVMRQHNIRHVVVTRGGKLYGVISIRDLVAEEPVLRSLVEFGRGERHEEYAPAGD